MTGPAPGPATGPALPDHWLDAQRVQCQLAALRLAAPQRRALLATLLGVEIAALPAGQRDAGFVAALAAMDAAATLAAQAVAAAPAAQAVPA